MNTEDDPSELEQWFINRLERYALGPRYNLVEGQYVTDGFYNAYRDRYACDIVFLVGEATTIRRVIQEVTWAGPDGGYSHENDDSTVSNVDRRRMRRSRPYEREWAVALHEHTMLQGVQAGLNATEIIALVGWLDEHLWNNVTATNRIS